MIFKHRNGKRICPVCNTILKKNGHSKNKRQRGYCTNCKKSINPNANLAKINRTKYELSLFIKYLLNTSTLEFLKINRMAFSRMTKKFRNLKLNNLCDINTYLKVIYLDAIYFADECCMIARNNDVVIGGWFCKRECYHDGYEFIRRFPSPQYVVCDGGTGLMSAIKDAGPNVKHQRCLFHVGMNIRTKLTLKPETQAGIELLHLGQTLKQIKNHQQKDEGLKLGNEGYTKYKGFVSEHTINPLTGEVGFTHKELRSAAGNLGKLISNNHLFYYLDDPDVSSVNNLLEGGINSRLKQLLYFHHGCSKSLKRKVIEFYLLKRSNYYNEVIHMLYNIKRK